MFEIIANDTLVQTIFESVIEKEGTPRDKLMAIVRAGKFASICLDESASPEAALLLHP